MRVEDGGRVETMLVEAEDGGGFERETTTVNKASSHTKVIFRYRFCV